jgi:glycosyltransferase involved in cell wall biosynthesis
MHSSQRLRVAFDMTLLEGRQGGSAVYARAMSRALREREDIDLEVVSAPASGAVQAAQWMAWRARRRVHEVGADILHSPAFFAPLRSPVPLIITIHDLSLGRMPSGHGLEWRLFYHLLLPPVARRAAALLTPTEATRRDVIETFGVSPERVFTTPYGVEERFFEASRRDRRESPAVPRIVFSGPPIGRKNLDLVLRAMAAASRGSALSRAQLEITGATSDEYPAYKTQIVQGGLTDRIRWLGRLADEDLPALYAGADLLVYPSFLEGFGFPPLEAMATGTPVVASNASCLPEVLGGAARLVDPGDDSGFAAAIESVLDEPAVRLRLVSAGLAKARTYTWKRCAVMVVAVYKHAAGG